jgi:hypothetical protein
MARRWALASLLLAARLGRAGASLATAEARVMGLLRVGWVLRATNVTFTVTALQPAGCVTF